MVAGVGHDENLTNLVGRLAIRQERALLVAQLTQKLLFRDKCKAVPPQYG